MKKAKVRNLQAIVRNRKGNTLSHFCYNVAVCVLAEYTSIQHLLNQLLVLVVLLLNDPLSIQLHFELKTTFFGLLSLFLLPVSYFLLDVNLFFRAAALRACLDQHMRVAFCRL